MKTLREGYTGEVKDLTVEEGVRHHCIERTITAPSGNQYVIHSDASITDVNNFKELGTFRSINAALDQIYIWEEYREPVLPNLKDRDCVISLLNTKYSFSSTINPVSSAINAEKLIDIGVIVPTLHTAIYLYELFSRTDEIGYNDISNMRAVIENLPLPFEDAVKFCNYAMNKNPECARCIPDELLVKCVRENVTDKLFSPNDITIDQEWLNSPEWSDNFEKETQSDLNKDTEEELDRDF